MFEEMQEDNKIIQKYKDSIIRAILISLRLFLDFLISPENKENRVFLFRVVI